MSIEGKLEEIAFPCVLQILHEKRTTGRLALNKGNLNKVLFLVEGDPVNVESTLRDETLGRYLLKKGKISEEDYEKSIQLMIEQGIQQGAALVRIGCLAPRDLYYEVKAQTREKLLTCFAWTKGSFAFYPEIDFVEDIYRFETSFPALMYEGVSRFFPAGEVERQLAKTGPGPIKPLAGFLEGLSGFGFSDEDTSYVFLVDGERGLLELKQAAGGANRAMKVFYLLLLSGLAGPDGELESAVRSLGGMEPELTPVEEFMVSSPTETSPEVVEEEEIMDEEEEAKEVEAGISEAPSEEVPPPPLQTRIETEEEQEDSEEVIEDWNFMASARKPVAEEGLSVEEERCPAEEEEYEGPPEGTVSFVEHEEAAAPKDASAKAEGPDKEESEILEFYVGHKGLDYFELMDLERDTSDEEVLEAYRRLRAEFDKNRFGALTDEGKDKLEEINAHIIRAYEALRTKEDRQAYLQGLDEAQKEKKVSTSLQAEQYLQKGSQYVRQRDWPKAQKMFEKAVEASPNEPEYYGYLGWSIYSNPEVDKRERTELAKKHISKAIELNPQMDSSHVFMGKILKEEGNAEEAVEEFRTALHWNPKCAEAERELKAHEDGKW